MLRITTRTILFVLLAWAVRPATASCQPYTFIPINTPPEFDGATAADVNNRQQVVGHLLRRVPGPLDIPSYIPLDAFLWDTTSGLRRLHVGRLYRGVGIDDAGVVYGVRNVNGEYRPFRWFDGTVTGFPLPPNETFAVITTVTNNGIVLMSGRKQWAFFAGTYVDLDALTGATICTLNEQGVLGGCKDNRPYMRFPDGRVVEPWQSRCGSCSVAEAGGVMVLGPLGHFAGSGDLVRGAIVDYYTHYGTPDGSLWTAVRSTSPTSAPGPRVIVRGINGVGTLFGHYSPSSVCCDYSFLFREGAFTDLRAVVLNWPTSGFGPTAINDAGYIIGRSGLGAAVLVPSGSPSPPAGVSFTVTERIVTLSWQGSFGAPEYVVEAGSAPGLANLYNASVGARLSVTTSAPPGRYYVRVRARSATGLSAPSNEVVIDVP